jgi:fatty-acid desaturase
MEFPLQLLGGPMQQRAAPDRTAPDHRLEWVKRFTTSNTMVFPYFQAIGAAATIAAVWFVPDWRWWLLALAMYFVNCCLGLTVTYHRCLTHRAFEMPKWQERLFSWFGAMGATGSPLGWVALHKHHHAYADKPGDPHSPRLQGWRTLTAQLDFDLNKWSVRHLARDPFHRALHQYYHALLAAWALLLFAISPMLLLFGFVIPAALQLNISSLSNYLNHGRGYRNFDTDDDSTNNALISLIAWGEGWHNNHHRYPTSWNLSQRWWEFDPSAWIIRLVRRGTLKPAPRGVK